MGLTCPLAGVLVHCNGYNAGSHGELPHYWGGSDVMFDLLVPTPLAILSASGEVSVCTDVPAYGYPSRVCSYRFCVRAFVIMAVYTHTLATNVGHTSWSTPHQ